MTSTNWNALREPRLGLMLHYSAGSYVGTLAWCRDARSQVSYQLVVGQHGLAEVVAPWDRRAWHAGVCRSSDPARLPYRDANSAFEGLALAASDGDTITAPAFAVLVEWLVRRFDLNGWARTDGWRIVGHDTEAWPRGRKIDPTGSDPARPVIDLTLVRHAVAAA